MTLKDFEEKVMKDENLRLQVEQTQSLSEFVKIANENGVNVTKEGLMNEVVKYRGMHDMNDQELEAVSGGVCVISGMVLNLGFADQFQRLSF